MQPAHEPDDVHDLLCNGYGAPQLDDQFSEDLIARLQAEAVPSSTHSRTRRSALAIRLRIVALAALVIAVVWISRLGSPKTNQELAHRSNTDSASMEDPARSLEIASNEGENVVFSRSEHADEPGANSEALSEPESAPNRVLGRDPPVVILEEARSLEQSVAEAEVIVVATGLSFAPATHPNNSHEHVISWRVTRHLKGKLANKVFVGQLPTDPQVIQKWYIGKETIVMLPPEYVEGKHNYAGLYAITLEPQVKAILSESQQ